jgi:hypothetical protein
VVWAVFFIWFVFYGGRFPADGFILAFVIAAVGSGVCFNVWLSLRIKKVETDGRYLYVSNYVRETAIPLSDIYDVKEMRWMQPYWITIELSRPSEFGNRIILVPPFRWGAFWTANPLVDDIRSRANEQRSPQHTGYSI